MQLRLAIIMTIVALLIVVLVACTASNQPDKSIHVEPETTDNNNDGTGVTIYASGTAVPQATASPQPTPNHLPPLSDMGPAPEILNDIWINTDTPLTLASQQGKVILLEFWTFG